MGYNVNMRGANFTIPADKLDAACQALKELNKHDELKSGGSFGPGDQREHWFSWMPADYDQTLHTTAEILIELGFEIMGEDGEDLTLVGYDSKQGDERTFLAALAPFVPAGSYVNWEGEDGDFWQDCFDGTTMTTKQGSIIYR